MAPGGGPPWPGRNVRGSFAGARVPSWMDQTGSFGSLTIMQLKCNGEGTSLPKDPFLIRRCLETYLNSKIEGGFPEQGGVTYGLKVRNTDHVAKLKNMTLLSDGISGGLRVNISIDEHPTLNFTKCTVFCTDVNHYEDERLLAELEDQNVTAIHRFTRMIDGERTKTGLMVLTIRGCIIPEIVSFGFIRARTKIYYPSPMMCFRCFSFGHTSKRCKASDPVCGRCSEGHSCPKEDPCKKLAYCARCESADHALSSRKCPVYVAEETIQHIKTDNDISYQAARRIYEQENQQQNTNAATIVTQGLTNQLQQPTLDSVVRKLDQVLQDLSQKDAKIADLAAENGKLLDTITGMQKTIDKQNQMIQEMAAVGCKESTSQSTSSSPDTYLAGQFQTLVDPRGSKILTKTQLKKLQKQQRLQQQLQHRLQAAALKDTNQQQEQTEPEITPMEQRPLIEDNNKKTNRSDSPDDADNPKRPKNDPSDPTTSETITDTPLNLNTDHEMDDA